MRRYVIILMAVMFLLPGMSARAQTEGGKFQEANAYYRASDFSKAAQLYQELVREYPRVAVFYYDLGNANVKLGEKSEAILAYEKALRLAPRDRDIRHNLNYVRGQLEYRVEDNRNWYLKATDAVLARFTEREIKFSALVFIFIFLVSGMVYFLFRQRVFWGGGRKFLFVLALIFIALAVWKHVQGNMMNDAIVMAKECEARYGPSEHDQVAFRMGEGIKVVVMDRREDWSRVLLTNGESGWVRNSDIAEVKV